MKNKIELTRQQKRHKKVIVHGKSMAILKYLRLVEKNLPVITLNKNGEKVDHYDGLKKIYMEKGLEGIDEYIEYCKKLIEAKHKDRMKVAKSIKKKVMKHIPIWLRIKKLLMRWLSWAKTLKGSLLTS